MLADLPEVQLVNLDYENARVTLRYDLQQVFPGSDPKKPPTEAEIEKRLERTSFECLE